MAQSRRPENVFLGRMGLALAVLVVFVSETLKLNIFVEG